MTRVALGLAGGLLLAWLVLVATLALARPRGALLTESVRLVPDVLRLLRRLAVDRTLPRSVHVRLWLLFAYLAMPFDLVPDFIPVLGYADDVIAVCIVLRSIVRVAGPDVIRRHWQGSHEGLAALFRVAGLPGTPDRQAALNHDADEPFR